MGLARNNITSNTVTLAAVVPGFFTWMLVSLSFIFPVLDSTRPSYFDMTGNLPELALWLSQSAGITGSTVLGIIMLILIVSRRGISRNQRIRETGILLLIVMVFAGGGAAFNEHVIKNRLEIPRPNIIWLAGNNGAGPLGMTAEEFYNSGDKQVRSQLLSQVLNRNSATISLSPAIKSHWITETGFSFPSGHSYSAMFFASFFLAIAVSYLTSKRIWLFYMLLPWALMVCYSRTILRLHTPVDITVGSLQGIIAGAFAWIIARVLIQKFSSSHTD